jgi:hypothetical protein
MSAVSTRNFVFLSFWLLLYCGLPACAAPQNLPGNSMHVEIDVYSGRPNPSFQLSDPLGKEFARMLEKLPRATREAADPGLGYRGFVVTPNPGADPALPKKVRVFDGLIVIEKGSAVETYVDANGAESWLKEHAVRAGYGSLVP